MDREEQNRLILAELARLYPDARPALHFANPFELLVAVMLSAQCTDVKVNMVTPALFAAYPDAAALAMAEPAEIGAAAAFLASSDSSFMTASELAVDGGLAQL